MAWLLRAPEQAYVVFDELAERIDTQLESLKAVMDGDVPRFVDLVHELEVSAVVPDAGEDSG